jgi:2-polyprenyl-3-methyl-5-hydroxy-6-metoxy-1,4-benzoquinol methylase
MNALMQPSATASRSENPARSRVEYLSPAAKVSMADQWFEIASIDHFWVRRRFEVLRNLTGTWLSGSQELAEIGCGHGLLQCQVEDACGLSVTGFDLNDFALKRNVSRRSRVCCYDIFQRDAALCARFDVIFLFDVLEHIADEDEFLEALRYHLAPGGKVVVNVPAGQWAFSGYDRAAGHVRRYSFATLEKAMQRNHLLARDWTYWGLPLVPVLAVRKLWLVGKSDQQEIITAGFDARSPAVNKMLGMISGWERIPQHLLGTSLMGVFQAEAP